MHQISFGCGVVDTMKIYFPEALNSALLGQGGG
ncbi:hypothetical protein C5S39_09495 [Candidatus Methanophagaceae archaeon]|nr:hypothetical protein C5S39_09495 [Methanophagales archaeon]